MNKTPANDAATTTAATATTTPSRPAGSAPTGNNAAWDADDEDTPYGDPAKVKDAGVLDSLGKAVSSPVTESKPEHDDQRSAADRKAGKA